MRGISRWVWVLAALAAAVIAGAALAKGRDNDSTVGERAACINNKRAHARYVIVSDAYERGELGAEREVIGSVHPKARPLIFEPDGELRAWNAMSRSGKHEFL